MTDNLVTIEPVYYNIEVIKQDNEVTIASPGPQGPIGNPGPKGDPGQSAGSFVFEQQSSSTIWTIAHNLGYRPAVFTTDYSKNTLEGDISHTDTNNLVITFTDSVVGYAYLS